MKRFFSFLFTTFLITPSLLIACEGCKMATSSGFKEPQTVKAGMALSWSVLFMLLFVFLLLAIFVWFIRSACQQADQAHQS